MTTEDPLLEAFKRDRDAALLSLDQATIMAYAEKYGVHLPDAPQAFWAGVHKARTGLLSMPMEARSESKRWLLARGFHSADDGDVPT